MSLVTLPPIPLPLTTQSIIPHMNSTLLLCNSPDKSISFLHCNIRSLSANFENLQHMLNTLNHPFKIIGLSQTWISFNKDALANLFLPGFDFISQPAKFSIGGVGLCIANTLRYTIRDDLISSSDQEESLWIEVQNDKAKNIVCVTIYRHPNSCLQSFLDAFL